MAKSKSDERHVFQGWIMDGRDGDYDRALHLIDHRTGVFDDPLARQVYYKTGFGSKQVSVCYHITDQPELEETLTGMVIAKMCGVSHSGNAETKYYHRYSELTGYLWTDEDFKVGGHDVLAELRSYKGKWCYLVVTFHGAKR